MCIKGRLVKMLLRKRRFVVSYFRVRETPVKTFDRREEVGSIKEVGWVEHE